MSDNKELICEVNESNLSDLIEMGLDLWPDETGESLYTIFREFLHSDKRKCLYYSVNGVNAAFIYVSIRTDYVEGSQHDSTGYLEAIYVKPEYRKKGIARKLVTEGEKWLKEKGCKQMGSDIYISNQVSYDFHTSYGFKEAARLIVFIKDL